MLPKGKEWELLSDTLPHNWCYRRETRLWAEIPNVNTLLQSDIVIFRFKPEVVQLFDGRGANNIFMDGKELAFILETG
jgi:hypothetical protein